VPALDQGKSAPSEFGDLLLNYRLQAIGKGGAGRPAMAPRLSVAFATGKHQTGSGCCGTGFQFNLPVSLEIGDHFVTHLNAGFTVTPRAKAPSSFSATALDTNAGLALVWLPVTWANPLVEFVHLTAEQI
jgi:hypothetical protein